MRQRKKCADDMVCCLLFGGCEQAARLIGSGYRRTVAAPPIEPSEQLLGAKSQPRAFVSALGRGVTADPIAINDINLPRLRRAVVSEFISRCGKLTVAGMWRAMYALVGLRKAGLPEE